MATALIIGDTWRNRRGGIECAITDLWKRGDVPMVRMLFVNGRSMVLAVDKFVLDFEPLHVTKPAKEAKPEPVKASAPVKAKPAPPPAKTTKRRARSTDEL